VSAYFAGEVSVGERSTAVAQARPAAQLTGFTHDFSFPSIKKEMRPSSLQLFPATAAAVESTQDSNSPVS